MGVPRVLLRALLAIVVVGVVTWSGRASAYAWMVRHDYTGCNQCHADPSGGGFRLGAYKWSHPTQPDFCSGETLYYMYFEATRVLFVFRFDSSSEC